MGFFSNLKNSLTGGWATVTLVAGDGVRGGTIPVTVNVLVKDSTIQVPRVYLKLECQEKIDIPNYSANVSASEGGATTRSTVDVHESNALFQREIVVATPGEMESGQSYSFEVEVEIPQDQPPTCRGRYFQLHWRMLAGLDMKGNDPDSGWVDMVIK